MSTVVTSLSRDLEVEALAVASGRRRRARRRYRVATALAVAVVLLAFVALMVGQTFYGPGEVLGVLRGERVPGASFTIGVLRLPRTALAVLAGAAFGLAGTTFQTMLRNPLASPDVIGISAGASAAAVLGLVVLGLQPTQVSALAIAGALLTALAIYLLAYRHGVAGSRLILIGIGITAMLDSVISYVLAGAASYDLATASRWLTGSLNAADWDTVAPLALALLVAAPVLLVQTRNLDLLQHGDDSAAALGVSVERTRVITILVAVVLIAFATAATGPISFVAFLSGPIAARLVGRGGSLMLPSLFTGALLTLTADLVGQFAFGTRYPVGVITGALGAPFLVYLLIRINRAGNAL